MSSRPDLKFVDIAEERGFYKRFLQLSQKTENTIRLVDKSEYYIVIGDDALFVADQVYHTSSVLKDCKIDPSTLRQFDLNDSLKYVTMSHQIVGNLLKTSLLELGKKVEIYDRNWKLLKTASPGNLEQVDDLIVGSLETNIVLASLKLNFNGTGASNYCTIGISFIDNTNYRIGLFDLLDNEVFSNLESCLIQLGVRECLIPDLRDSPNMTNDLKKILSVIDRCSCVASFVKPSDFNGKDVESDLAKLCGNELSLSVSKFSTDSLGACSVLLNYLNIMSEETNIGNFEIVDHSLSQFVKLDASAIKALNVFPANSQGATALLSVGAPQKCSSLFQLLNKCKTNSGVRLLNEWLKQPLTDIEQINKRHDLVEFFIDQLELRSSLQEECLPSVPDIRRLTKKLHKNGNLEDVLKIYQFAQMVPVIMDSLTRKTEEVDSDNLKALVQEVLLDPMLENAEPLEKLKELVETTVDLEAYEETNEFMIKVEFNEQLSIIRAHLDELKDAIKTIHIDAADDLGFDPEKKLKLENHHLHGWCMRLTRNDAKALRQHKKYIELSTVKAGIFFSTKELKQIAEDTSELQKKYEQQQSSLVKEIVSITLSYTPVLEKLAIVIAQLDILCSFAQVSSYAPVPYIRPTMYPLNDEHRKTELIASRHPIVEMQDDVTFISNDVNLVQSESEFIIITGPNMGGKSTYIRQIGVICLMAQIGCFVPCDEAKIAVVDAILCRVGAGDSQLKGVSTFMMEMLETASILKNATKNSLVIVDELGRGTSTYDGFGLAWSISEFIATKIKCFTLFATHFHELTTLSDKLQNVSNMHVVAHIEDNGTHNSDDITLLYKVEPGSTDQSFGIHVAEIVQFPAKIVNMAKRKAAELEELKKDNESLKRAKLTPEEIVLGTEALKKILKLWHKELEDNNLTERLEDPSVQEECADKLKNQIDKWAHQEMTNPQFVDWIRETLL
ncbi:unnamed protein product [Kluyveromyces dobzhanskii CBS 2104]|uniref:DNA mismatch repair protein MSH2 n=1 Tax=Kluyveromyces dobzhanskii CBS 2104 TaxID=1427455 RepID=A0A0A8L5W3_9SACH|nr:unnamed protein product [Kluyveromyces dobzhanskii CBS 2104]